MIFDLLKEWKTQYPLIAFNCQMYSLKQHRPFLITMWQVLQQGFHLYGNVIEEYWRYVKAEDERKEQKAIGWEEAPTFTSTQ